jgi:AraC-like DNA-binding protein
VADVIKRIERGSRRNRATEVIDQGPLAAPDLAAFEDRLIRSLLRGRLPAPAEAAAELIAAWEKKGLAVEQRLRSFAFALAREAERCAGAGGIVDEVTRGLPPDALIGGGEARDALVELLVAWASPSAAESGETGPRILDWLSETPLADLSLDALAERLRMSPASASRLFRDRIGKSFTAYASALRMERAVTIASSGEEFTLEELSRRVGYGDSAYFGRLFKEHTGLSPREYAREFARMNRQG